MTGPEPRAGRLVSTESPLIPMQGGELRQPKRAMGFLDLVLFYVVTGISLRWIATAASAGPSAVVIWAGAWLAFYTPLALSVIELSSRYPQEGGLYIWSKRAFGDFAGFLVPGYIGPATCRIFQPCCISPSATLYTCEDSIGHNFQTMRDSTFFSRSSR